jgi:hypothetical protein
LLRVDVRGAADGWYEAVPGVRLDEANAHGTVLELDPDVDAQRVLDLARSQGEVRAFVPIDRSLAELFRETVGDGDP